MIYIDMDGVLCDLVAQVERELEVYHIYNESNYGTYNIQDACAGIGKEDLLQCFQGYYFWAEMPSFEWSQYILSWAEGTGKEVYILSRPWLLDGLESASNCLQGKIDWIASFCPEYLGRLLFVDKKEDFATPDSILIDDNMENCEKFSAAGGKTIFIPTPWGDLNYVKHEKSGFELVKEVLECQTKIVESM